MEALPDLGLLPVPQAAPAGATAPVAQLTWQVLPGDAGPQNEENAGQNRAIVTPPSTALRLVWALGEEGLNDRPQVVWEDLLRHPPELTVFAAINRGAVK